MPLLLRSRGTSQRNCDSIVATKTATVPSVRVEADFRIEVEAVPREGGTLSEFVEASVRAGVGRNGEMRPMQPASGYRLRAEA